ncbi:hypothetical protein [Aurantiacibacter sp. MUD61]|uniref:hypothetical protein n=1 Tax=Aurantiacibacter sp. MUD61 TaxID=3009083 RepID=UPI0022F06A1F|nr:hypothetical protein [Aurantiacibacter sp. MUD61]
MKRIVVFAAATALGLTLAACGEAADEGAEEMGAESEYSAEAADDSVVMSDAEADAIVDEAAEDSAAMEAEGMEGEDMEEGDAM